MIALDDEIAETETLIAERFRRHRYAEILTSIPGFGPTVGAEFLTATGGEMTVFGSVDRLAGVAGLAPVPKDSGRISGNQRRPRTYSRKLLRACYLAAHIASRSDAVSRTYQRKLRESKTHTQAAIALARHRLDIQGATLRDLKRYTPTVRN